VNRHNPHTLDQDCEDCCSELLACVAAGPLHEQYDTYRERCIHACMEPQSANWLGDFLDDVREQGLGVCVELAEEFLAEGPR